MWFKRKAKEEKAPVTEVEFEASIKYAENLLTGILAECGDGVHFMRISTTGMEDVNFLFGRKDPNLYNIMPLDLLTARVAMRSHAIKNFIITLESFRNLDPTDLDGEILDASEGPDEVCGWLVKDLAIIPLTAKQIFDFWYSDEEDEVIKAALEEKAVLQKFPFGDATGKVAYRDAWVIN